MKDLVRFAMFQGVLGVGAVAGAGVALSLGRAADEPEGVAQRAERAGPAEPEVDGDLADWEAFGPPKVVRTASGAELHVRARVDARGLLIAGQVFDDVTDAGLSPLTGDRVDITVRAEGPVWSERVFRVKPGGVSVAWEDGPALGPCCASEGVQRPTASGWAFEVRVPARELPAGRRTARLAALGLDLVDEDNGVPKAMARGVLDAGALDAVSPPADTIPDGLVACAAFVPGDDAPIVMRDGQAARVPTPVRVAGGPGVGVWEGSPCVQAGVLAITGEVGISHVERRGYALARVGAVDDGTRLVLYRFAPGDRHRTRVIDIDGRGAVVGDRELVLTDDGDPATIPVDGTVELELDRVTWSGTLQDDAGGRRARTLGLAWDAARGQWTELR